MAKDSINGLKPTWPQLAWDSEKNRHDGNFEVKTDNLM